MPLDMDSLTPGGAYDGSDEREYNSPSLKAHTRSNLNELTKLKQLSCSYWLRA